MMNLELENSQYKKLIVVLIVSLLIGGAAGYAATVAFNNSSPSTNPTTSTETSPTQTESSTSTETSYSIPERRSVDIPIKYDRHLENLNQSSSYTLTITRETVYPQSQEQVVSQEIARINQRSDTSYIQVSGQGVYSNSVSEYYLDNSVLYSKKGGIYNSTEEINTNSAPVTVTNPRLESLIANLNASEFNSKTTFNQSQTFIRHELELRPESFSDESPYVIEPSSRIPKEDISFDETGDFALYVNEDETIQTIEYTLQGTTEDGREVIQYYTIEYTSIGTTNAQRPLWMSNF